MRNVCVKAVRANSNQRALYSQLNARASSTERVEQGVCAIRGRLLELLETGSMFRRL